MNRGRLGFTIVELLVVIVVIGILAGVAIVGYGAWRNSTTENIIKSDLSGAASAMESGRNFGTDYPENLPATFKPSEDVTMKAKSGGGTYCVEATSKNSPDIVFNIKNGRQPVPGPCDAYYTAATIVTGSSSCGIEYGKAYCWGEASGAGSSAGSSLGSGPASYSTHPMPVDTTIMKGKVTAIESSNATVCAIADGKVYCWGNGAGGLLGNGSTTSTNVPVAVDTTIMRGHVTSLSMGSMTACAIAGGKAYCWGVAHSGQLGHGATPSQSTVPVAVNTSTMTGDVSSISLANTHACAISDFKAYCWGTGSGVGSGSNSTSSVPTAVTTTEMSGKVTYLQASASHTCAIADAKAYCWGSGGYSQTANGHLGNGSSASVNVPTAVNTSVMSGAVTQLKTRAALTCAIADEKAYCWGENNMGQLGNGTTTSSAVPVEVNTSTMSKKVSAIEIGHQVCAISEDKLYCWGSGTSGQLGNGSSSNSTTPVAVTTSVMKGKVTSVMLSTQFSCAASDDRIYCWGINTKGQLGNASVTNSNVPVRILPNP